MRVLVVVDGHLGRTPDGNIWSSKIYNYDFFARYLNVFEKVRVAIRIHDIDSNEGYPNLCSGDNLEFFPIEEFKGPKEYLQKYFLIKKNIKRYFEGCDCGIFRIPSTVGYQFLHEFQKTKKPYAVEVVVDPWDFAAPGMLDTPLRPIIRWKWTRDLKSACLCANGVSYVTKYALQERYPSYAQKYGPSNEKFESYYSSVNIPISYYGIPRIYNNPLTQCKIVHVTNSISSYVKGHKELIQAVRLLKDEGLIVKVDFVGDGDLISEFINYSSDLGVIDQINFIGKLSTSEEVRNKLLRSDLFVFPSYAEGLPRVLIEAMAVGLPCISTNVNGIPELLDKEYLTEVGDVVELAKKIKSLLMDKKQMTLASENNINIAREYSEEILQMRRIKFYKKLKMLAENKN